MSDWNERAKALNKYIRPLTFPVGVRLVEGSGDFPEKTRFPRDMGFKATPCVGIALARKYGWTVGITPQDNPCPVASYLYGWSNSEEESREILSDFMKAMRYVATDDAVDAIVEEATQFKLDKGQCAGVVMSPFELGRVEPDLVMKIKERGQKKGDRFIFYNHGLIRFSWMPQSPYYPRSGDFSC